MVDATVARLEAFIQMRYFRERMREIIAEVLVHDAVDSYSETQEEEEE